MIYAFAYLLVLAYAHEESISTNDLDCLDDANDMGNSHIQQRKSVRVKKALVQGTDDDEMANSHIQHRMSGKAKKGLVTGTPLSHILEVAQGIQRESYSLEAGRDIESVIPSSVNDAQTMTGEQLRETENEMNTLSMAISVEEAVHDGVEITTNTLNSLTGNKEGMENTQGSDLLVVEGDIVASGKQSLSMLQEAAQRGARWAGKLWPVNQSVPFCFPPDIAASTRQAFMDAVVSYQNYVPCLSFHEVGHVSGTSTDADSQKSCQAPHAIFISSESNGKCNANVGMQDDNGLATTRVQLSPGGCDTVGVAIHELGHALGMHHEHSRPDRNEYVTVLWDNVEPDSAHNFDIASGGDQSQPYDILSIMHYGADYFGKDDEHGNKLPTLAATDGTETMGQRMGLSNADVHQVASMYGCDHENLEVCSFDVSACTVGQCVCPQQGVPVIKVNQTLANGDYCYACVEECPSHGSECTQDDSCACPQGFIKTEGTTADGESCFRCATVESLHCPSDGTSACSTDSSCTCPVDLIKDESISTSGDACFKCVTAADLHCPSDGTSTCSTDASCTCPADMIKQESQSATSGDACFKCVTAEALHCPSDGTTACSTDASCTCPAGLTQVQGTTGSGASCYSCHGPCPSAPGGMTSDRSCLCAANQRKVVQFEVPGGESKRACEGSVPVTQYGCACKQSWSFAGFSTSSYTHPYGSNSFCITEIAGCDAGGAPYGWYAFDG